MAVNSSKFLSTYDKSYRCAPTSRSSASRTARPSSCYAVSDGDKNVKRPVVAVAAASQYSHSSSTCVVASNNLVSMSANVNATDKVMKLLNPPLQPNNNKLWHVQLQMFIEKVIVDCRFFTLFAVAGSLLGSVLCLVEGCVIIVQSYVHYFHTLSHKSDQHVVHLLIEAIDMFLVGTAMLVFGMGLYVTYVGTKSTNENESWLPGSNFFGLFNSKTIPSWVQMQSVSEAKSKIGHAVMMILQVGVLEKFRSIPLVNGVDLACFAGALLFSSAGVFVLSRLSVNNR